MLPGKGPRVLAQEDPEGWLLTLGAWLTQAPAANPAAVGELDDAGSLLPPQHGGSVRGGLPKPTAFRTCTDPRHRPCHVCGERPERFLACHEVWDYDDAAGVATLVDFALNCWACDAATHTGCAGRTGRKETARAQLQKVNRMSAEEVESLLAAAGEEWARRSQMGWTVEVARELTKRYPVLVGLFDARARGRNVSRLEIDCPAHPAYLS